MVATRGVVAFAVRKKIVRCNVAVIHLGLGWKHIFCIAASAGKIFGTEKAFQHIK